MKVKILMIAILMVFLNSLNLNCSSRFGDFTVVSTRNSNVKNWQRYPSRVEGYSCRWWILFIPVKDWDLKDAIEDAVDKSNKNTSKTNIQSESLLDVKFSIVWFTTILFTRSCIYANGTPADSWYKVKERIDQIKE